MTIRRTPADFIVTERLTTAFETSLRAAPDPTLRHAVYRLEKTSLTTPEAVAALARALNIPVGAIEYAGLKDKHAQTSQHVSFPLTKDRRDSPPPETVTHRGISAARIGWAAHPITADVIDHNAFRIVVRDLSRGASDVMTRHARTLASGASSLLVVNYFGDQRFGSARHEAGFAAAHLIRGDFETALKLLIATPARKDSGHRRTFTRLCATHWGDWKRLKHELSKCPERKPIEALVGGSSFKEAFASLPNFIQQMAVDAWQSHLWNAVARRCAAELDNSTAITVDDAFGVMCFPAPGRVPPEWRDVNIPHPSADCAPAAPWQNALQGALAEEGVGLSELHIPGLRRPAFGNGIRPLFMLASGFQMSGPEPDELSKPGRRKRTVEFNLPRGGYATVVLRALGQ